MSNNSLNEFGLSEFEVDLIPAERRSEVRRDTLLQAEIRVSEGSTSIPCVVNDISKSGARVLFEDNPKLSRHVHLVIHHPMREYTCEVRWQNGDEAGLMFIFKASTDSLHN